MQIRVHDAVRLNDSISPAFIRGSKEKDETLSELFTFKRRRDMRFEKSYERFLVAGLI